MEALLCNEESVASLLEVPTAQANSLETPEELMEYDSSCEGLQGRLPEQCSEDIEGRLAVLLELEQGQLTSDYLRRQPCFDATHRFAIVQWLHVACYKFKLNASALAIAVRLLDRFLDVHIVQARHLRDAQCVAVACLTLAAKLDGPDAVDNVAKYQVDTDIWSTSFTAAQIRATELMILSALDWRSHCATAVDFLDCLLCLANVGRASDGSLLDAGRPASAVRRTAHHLILQTLADSDSVAMRPSCVAAAAILAALHGCHGAGPALADAYYSFSLHIDQEELQWCLDQLRNNSPDGDSCQTALQQQSPTAPAPVTPTAPHPPLRVPPPAIITVHEKHMRLSPTSVLVTAVSLPESEMSFETM